jgi:hypothetical protein
MEVPGTSHAHVGGKGQQQGAQKATHKMKTTQGEDAREKNAGHHNVREMLIDERPGYQSLGQPNDRREEKCANERKQILPHADLERPGRDPDLAEVIRTKNVIRIKDIQRITPDILVEEHEVSEDKVAENDQAHDQNYRSDYG